MNDSGSSYRLRVLRPATVAGRWTEAHAVVTVGSELYAAVLVRRGIAEPADAATAERIGPLVHNVPTRTLKRFFARELERRRHGRNSA
jgi:hypothetical protein